MVGKGTGDIVAKIERERGRATASRSTVDVIKPPIAGYRFGNEIGSRWQIRVDNTLANAIIWLSGFII